MAQTSNTRSNPAFHALLAALGLGFLALDQWTKTAIAAYFERPDHPPPVPVLGGLFHLTYTHNTGGAFGIMAGETVGLPLMVISVGALGFIGWYYWLYRRHRGICFALALVASGAIGNFADRVRLGYVIDFIDVDIGSYQWPFFNVADSLICVGAGLLVIQLWRQRSVPLPEESAVNE